MNYIPVIIAIIVVIQIFLLLEDARFLEVTRAGKVDKQIIRYRLQRIGKIDNVEGLNAFAVSGESMRDFDIHDGDVVYVHQYNDEEKYAINTYPVLMFSIDGMRVSDSRYKLRKFVSYINDIQSENWSTFYESNKERLETKISKDDFVKMCNEKVDKLKKRSDKSYDMNEQFILSETHEDRYLFSLHPTKSLYGKVCYAI